jgi:predicted SAM-dependent methyltransferase
VSLIAGQLELSPAVTVEIEGTRARVRRVVRPGSTVAVVDDAGVVLPFLADLAVRGTIDPSAAIGTADIASERFLDLGRKLAAAGILVRRPEQRPTPEQTPISARADEVSRLAQSLDITANNIASALRILASGIEKHAPAQFEQLARELTWAHELACAAERAITEQQTALPQLQAQDHLKRYSSRGRDLKLNLGCGSVPLPGWLNIDAIAGDIRMDLRWALPFDSEAASFVYMAHVLEHLNYKNDALAVAKEIRRVLKPSGVARIVVPDIGAFFRAYAASDLEFFAEFTRLWSRPKADSALASFLHYAGAGAFPGVLDAHHFGYDFDTLRALLTEAGFMSVERKSFLESEHAELRVDQGWAASAETHCQKFALIVEAS